LRAGALELLRDGAVKRRAECVRREQPALVGRCALVEEPLARGDRDTDGGTAEQLDVLGRHSAQELVVGEPG